MDIITWLQQQAETIARRGSAVHEEIARLVAGASARVQDVAGGLAGIARAVVEGAAKGAERASADDQERVLRAVVDGIADGFEITAQAARLALAEAATNAARFVREDVDRLTLELRDLPDKVASVVADAGVRVLKHGAEQGRTLAEHAGIALRRSLPAIEAALASAREHPGELLKQGGMAVRGAAGGLFSALAQHLDRLGARLKGEDGGTPPAGPASS
ncbi:MAG TPA: DUF6781 family protein [Planctomycetota bacterium]|nr:DUF6781 family protein [Planctomycetota bacterium]